jgi:Flp pilus assembly protein TadG
LKIFHRLSSFCANRSGNIALLFAIAAFPLMAATGAAVDYARSSKQHSRVQSSLDAAILAGVIAGKASLDNGLGQTVAITAANVAAQNSFNANLGSATSASLTATFTLNGLTMSGVGSASTSVDSAFMQLFGINTTAINVSSKATSAAQPYINVYLLIDISASMLLPSTSAGISQMIDGQGCALACHDKANGMDSYKWALQKNIQLRFQVVNLGIQNLVTYLNSQSALKSHVKIELWAFDHAMTRLVPLTSNFSTISNNFPAPSLADTDASAATPFDSLINTFVNSVGTAGDGSSFASPQKMVIIATDGVNDPTRAWVSNTSLRSQVRVFDTTFCTTLKNRGFTVAIINTPYYPMPWDWGYNATLGQPGTLGGATRVDDIPIRLKNCAGKYFTIASDVPTIQASFVNLFTMAQSTRLTQ